MNDYDDGARLRIRDEESEDEITLSGLGDSPSTGGTFVGITREDDTYPVVAARVFMCEVQSVTGDETEGATGVLTTHTELIPVLNVGPNIPPVGTKIIATDVDFRWVMDY